MSSLYEVRKIKAQGGNSVRHRFCIQNIFWGEFNFGSYRFNVTTTLNVFISSVNEH